MVLQLFNSKKEQQTLRKDFSGILLSNSYDICQVQTEWDRLKYHIRYILGNNLKTAYLDIWKKYLPIAPS